MARYDIFISYARINNDRVRPLVDLLRSRGYRVFYDQNEILVSDKWKDRLSRSVAASRVLVLCWSEQAAASEYVRYELFRAEGLKRRVLPWYLDRTELPKLVEIQGIKEQDPAKVLEQLRPRLKLQLRWWRRIEVIVLFLLLGTAYTGYRWTHRPWLLAGIVRSTVSEAPLSGVTVEVNTPDMRHYSGKTHDDGVYAIYISLPKPVTVDILFRKDGFDSDHEHQVPTNLTYPYPMVLHPTK